MREEIHRLFERVVWQDDADMLDVLSADRTVVTPALAMLYGLPAPAGGAPGFAEQSLASVPTRKGLLTLAGILTLTSVGGRGSSIVDRGAFIARNILCKHIPEPPSNVPELPPADKGKSERDRLAQHRADPACGACHNQLDPLGLAFETYDAIGVVQTMDQQGNQLTGMGTLAVGDQQVAYSDVRSFVAALARSPELGDCMVRKMVQYTFARPLAPVDDPSIKELAARFVQGGRKYRAFLGSLAEGAWIRSPGVSL
jgi:hypothetical protein